jgi:hypothetical protein
MARLTIMILTLWALSNKIFEVGSLKFVVMIQNLATILKILLKISIPWTGEVEIKNVFILYEKS